MTANIPTAPPKSAPEKRKGRDESLWRLFHEMLRVRVIERRSLPVEIFRLFMPDGFDEIGDSREASVAITADPAVFALKVGAEFAVRAKASYHVAVIEMVGAEVFHHAIPFKNRAAEIPR